MSGAKQVLWLRTRPQFSIRMVQNSTPSNCYHVTLYEVISWIEMTAEDFKRLDECGLLGMGQAYSVVESTTVTDHDPAVTVDAQWNPTGEPPVNWQGLAITNTVEHTYFRYVVKRICDSGD